MGHVKIDMLCLKVSGFHSGGFTDETTSVDEVSTFQN